MITQHTVSLKAGNSAQRKEPAQQYLEILASIRGNRKVTFAFYVRFPSRAGSINAYVILPSHTGRYPAIFNNGFHEKRNHSTRAKTSINQHPRTRRKLRHRGDIPTPPWAPPYELQRVCCLLRVRCVIPVDRSLRYFFKRERIFFNTINNIFDGVAVRRGIFFNARNNIFDGVAVNDEDMSQECTATTQHGDDFHQAASHTRPAASS